MEKPIAWKRKRLVISPKFQWPIILKTLIFTVLVSGVSGWSIFYFLWKSSLSSGNPSLVGALFQPGLWIGWTICLLVCLFVSALMVMKLTHRIAGQMYRFEKAVDMVLGGGKFKDIRTRKNDYFHEFGAELNRYLNQRKK